MKTESTSLSGGESFAPYGAAIQKSFKAEVQPLTDSLSPRHLTPLQHGRLLTQDVVQIYRRENSFALQTTHSLAHNHVSNWIHIENLELVLLVQRITKARSPIFEQILEQEEQWQERMRKCLIKFKFNFQRYCETIRQTSEHAEESADKDDLKHKLE